MLLRHQMKRTTSLKEIVFDVGGGEEDPHNPFLNHHHQNNSAIDGLDQRMLAMVSPRNNRRHSADFLLRVCSLCHRRLVPGRDIYMYKGDRGFCSVECRQQQMKLEEIEEGKKKCSMAVAATKKETVAVASAVTEVSAINGETVAAV